MNVGWVFAGYCEDLTYKVNLPPKGMDMMKYLFKIVVIFLFSSFAFANNPQILKDKILSYAENPQDIQAAAQDVANEALTLGKQYSHYYKMTPITTSDCLQEVTILGTNANNYYQKALGHSYKILGVVDGNVVMMIASSAALITHKVLDQGSYCYIDKSYSDAYWAAYLLRIVIDNLHVAFS